MRYIVFRTNSNTPLYYGDDFNDALMHFSNIMLDSVFWEMNGYDYCQTEDSTEFIVDLSMFVNYPISVAKIIKKIIRNYNIKKILE